MEVTTKREHDVVSSEVASLQENVFDEGIHTLINIVIKKVGIILKELDELTATVVPFIGVRSKQLSIGTLHKHLP